jgi:hypothetical protein
VDDTSNKRICCERKGRALVAIICILIYVGHMRHPVNNMQCMHPCNKGTGPNMSVSSISAYYRKEAWIGNEML